ncbi:MAG: Fic family protein, partial [Campylobacterota bacterium]|nr:Fic family protein [Campylobacterota bacterium]
MSYKPPYIITSKILNLSTQISEELTKLKFNSSSKTTPLLRKKNRIKTLAGTLEIEGNFLGEEKITAIIEGKRVLATVPELAEVQGAIKAYEKLDEYRYDNIDDLLNAHKILMNEILTTAGNFRTINVQVGEHIAPQAHMVNDLMVQLFNWLESSDEHMLLKSCIFHYEFEFIHPFSDGNGRIGRLWQSVILNTYNPLFSLLPTESIVRDHQEEYYKALEDSTNIGKSTPFIEFMLEMILESIKSTLKSNQQSNQKSDQKILHLMKENN